MRGYVRPLARFQALNSRRVATPSRAARIWRVDSLAVTLCPARNTQGVRVLAAVMVCALLIRLL